LFIFTISNYFSFIDASASVLVGRTHRIRFAASETSIGWRWRYGWKDYGEFELFQFLSDLLDLRK